MIKHILYIYSYTIFHVCIYWSNIHTQKSKFDPEKCYFKPFPSIPSNHDLQAFQWSMSAKKAGKSAKIPGGQLFRDLSTCVIYTALKKAGGQGNLVFFPVEMVSAMLCAPLGFFCLLACLSHTSLGKARAPLFWESVIPDNTEKRASDHFSPAGYALH